MEALVIDDLNGTNGNGHAVLDDVPAANGVAHGPEELAGSAKDAPAEDALEGLPAALESMLLAAGQPVPIARLVQALDGPSRSEVVQALDALAARYERDRRGLRIVQVAGGYQLRSAPEHARWIRRLLQERPSRLTRPMLETLAVVAYRQPCTRIDVEAVRGVDCDAVLATLTDRRLVRILGRKEAPGRPLLYGTTREFLEVFGLPDLTALPTLRELGVDADILTATDLTVGPEGVLPTGTVEVALPADAEENAACTTPDPAGEAT